MNRQISGWSGAVRPTRIAALAMLLALGSAPQAAQITIDASIFDQATLNGLEYDAERRVLRLTGEVTTFPILWIANSGEVSVSKWDVETNREIARYWTHFPEQAGGAWSGPAPSRTAVDIRGNVYVANRHFDGRPPAVMKILNQEAVDHLGDGQVNTSRDLNDDGAISKDPEDGEMMPLVDANSNNRVDPDELRDDRIAWHVTVGENGNLGRALCIGTDGHIWLGMYNGRAYYKLDSETGEVLLGPISTGSHTPYGCLIDRDGMLWSASLSSNLGQLNTLGDEPEWVGSYSHPGFNYGIAISQRYVFLANQSGFGSSAFIRYDKGTGEFDLPAERSFGALGIATDGAGNVVVGNSSGGVTKFTEDGEVIWEAPPQPQTGDVRGVVLDANGDVWAVHLNSNRLSKYSGSDGEPLGVFPAGLSPYTYSDAAGLGARGFTSRLTGFMRVVIDGLDGRVVPPGTVAAADDEFRWSNVCAEVPQNPEGATIDYRIRAAETVALLEQKSFRDVKVGDPLPDDLVGRFLEVEVQITANDDNQSPELAGFGLSTVGLNCVATSGIVGADERKKSSSSSFLGCSAAVAGVRDPLFPALVVMALAGLALSRQRRSRHPL